MSRLAAGLLLVLGSGCASEALLAPPEFERFDLGRGQVRADAFPGDEEVVLLARGELRLVWDPAAQVPLARLRRLERVQRIRATDEGQVEVEIEPFSKVLALRVRVHRPGGRVDAFEGAERVERLDGYRGLRVDLGPLEAGAVVEAVSDVWYTDLSTLPAWAFDGPRPTLRSELAVVVPPRFRIDPRFREDGVFVERPPERFVTEAGVRYAWSLADLPPLRDEPGAPGAALRGRWAHVLVTDTDSSYPLVRTWSDAERWIDSKAGTSTLTAAFVTEARRAAGEGSLEDRARALHALIAQNLVQDGDAPLWRSELHHPEAVMAAKRASPSSKGWVLLALLRAAGIPARPYLFADRAQDQLEPDFPWMRSVVSIGAWIDRDKGGPLLLDPTFMSSSATPADAQGRRVVVLNGDRTLARRVAAEAPEKNAARVRYVLTPAANGDVDGRLEATLEGATAAEARRRLLEVPPEKLTDVASALLRELGARLGPVGVSVGNLSDPRRPLVLKGRVFAAGLLTPEAGSRTLSAPLSAWLGPTTALAPRRRSPRRFGPPASEQVRVELTLPEAWVCDLAPEIEALTRPPSSELLLGAERSDEGVVLRWSQRRGGDRVPREDLPSFVEASRAVEASAERLLRLTPPPQF